MELLYILGALGGIMFLIEELHDITIKLQKWHVKYRKMQTFYEKEHDYVKMPMGFRTESEEQIIKAKKGA